MWAALVGARAGAPLTHDGIREQHEPLRHVRPPGGFPPTKGAPHRPPRRWAEIGCLRVRGECGAPRRQVKRCGSVSVRSARVAAMKRWVVPENSNKAVQRASRTIGKGTGAPEELQAARDVLSNYRLA